MGKLAGDALDDLLGGKPNVEPVQVVVPKAAAKALEATNGTKIEGEDGKTAGKKADASAEGLSANESEKADGEKSERMVTLTVRFPLTTYKAVRDERLRRLSAAEQGDVSLGEVIRDCVDLVFAQRSARDRNGAAAIARDDYDKFNIQRGE